MGARWVLAVKLVKASAANQQSKRVVEHEEWFRKGIDNSERKARAWSKSESCFIELLRWRELRTLSHRCACDVRWLAHHRRFQAGDLTNYGTIRPMIANSAATKLTPNATVNNLIARAAGATFEARSPSSRCNSGPRSQLDQIANEITIRSAAATARVRPISSIGGRPAGFVGAARVDRGRQRISQVNRLGLS